MGKLLHFPVLPVHNSQTRIMDLWIWDQAMSSYRNHWLDSNPLLLRLLKDSRLATPKEVSHGY